MLEQLDIHKEKDILISYYAQKLIQHGSQI